jgi:hypothetical protein
MEEDFGDISNTMNTIEFKKLFGNFAQINGFEFAFKGWFKQSKECIMVLDLQKSSYGSNYYLNIKIYVQGTFGQNYHKSAELLKNVGDFFRRQPKEYEEIFNLENNIDDVSRKVKLESFFTSFLNPFTEKGLTKQGIKELIQQGELALLPAVKSELGL